MNNKKLGNDFEAQFCEILFQEGFWCHTFAQNQAGQPADVIAAKNGKGYLIDCKVCSSSTFSLSRIEDNQKIAMNLWEECGNGKGWFALKIEGKIIMVQHPLILNIAEEKSVMGKAEILHYGFPLEEWIRECK